MQILFNYTLKTEQRKERKEKRKKQKIRPKVT